MEKKMKNKKQRFTVWLFAALLLLGCAYAYGSRPRETAALVSAAAADPASASEKTESFLAERLPFAETLRETCLKLRLFGGLREKDGVYIASGTLIEAFDPADSTTLPLANTQALYDFAGQADTPTYLLLIPTACAVYQERLPDAAPLYDQKSFIDDVYRRLAGRISAVDLYPALFSAREDDLYYNTDSSLTSLGAFRSYQTLAARLGLTPRAAGGFTILPLCREFYGDLYDRWGYGGVKPDVVTAYAAAGDGRLYRVVNQNANGTRVYHELYPACAAAEGSALDSILGGEGQRVDVEAVNLYTTTPRLLVFGDRTSFALVPFLALHYQLVTFIDLDKATDAQLSGVTVADYDQVLFACSVESYMETSAYSRCLDVRLSGGLQ